MTWEEKWNSLHLSPESRDFIRDYYRNDISGYITDLSMEFSDNSVDIYTADLMDWAGDHIWEIDETIKEYGWTGEFLDAIRMAQRNVTERAIMNDPIELRWALRAVKDIAEEEGIDIEGIDFEDFDIDTDEIDKMKEEVKEWLENVSVFSLR